VDFKNTVVIMTSNLGSQFLADHVGQAGEPLGEETRRRVLDALRTHVRPEFLNRIDEIVFFHSLGRDHLRQIVDILLRGLTRRLEGRKMRLELTDKARTLLVDEGYDPVYGARPLKRAIQRLVQDPLALRVLAGDFKQGDTINVDQAGGELKFTREETGGARST